MVPPVFVGTSPNLLAASTSTETAGSYSVSMQIGGTPGSTRIGPAFKGKRLGEITKSEIRKLIDGISKRGAPVGANRALAATKTCSRFASNGTLSRYLPP